jgi:hypothetical protein
MVAPPKKDEAKEENEDIASLSSREGHEEEEEDEDEVDFENDVIIRAKWTIDGACSLDQVVEHLEGFIGYIQGLKAQGYELRGPVQDDYGFCYKKE